MFGNRVIRAVIDFLDVGQVLIDNIEEYAPIVYTPTVGLACQNYSGLYRRPRGMYFSAADRGEMMSMVYNWPADQVFGVVGRTSEIVFLELASHHESCAVSYPWLAKLQV